jgi:putative ABC transport system substrate-binding protein
MSTRVILFVLALGFLLSSSNAQQPAKIPRVGLLSPADPMSPLFEAFRQGLADLGYVEGKNVVIVPRFAKGQYNQFPGLVADLLREKVDILAVQGAVTVRAAKKAVPDVPIVFAVVVDPVKDDLVTNLERPGGNISGITTFDPQQPRKQLELLRQVVPGLKLVALLSDAGVSEAPMRACDEQARAKVLKGAKAGDLPVETLTHYQLIVNQKTADEIGLTIPTEVLRKADRVIQ